MSNILIVDDEKFVVKSLCTVIDWASVGVENVFPAYEVKEAIRLLEREEIDLVICDIEMIGGSGIEVLAWVHEHHLDTRVIILTGHADFQYAQRALRLGAKDYLLKPVDHKELLEIVRRELSVIREQEAKEEYFEIYRKGYSQWERQLPLLAERFWQNIIGNKVYIEPERISHMISTYHIGISCDTKILPLLISITNWDEPLSTREEEVMEYGIRNIAEEMLRNVRPGTVIRDNEGNNYALLYFEPDEEYDVEELLPTVKQFVDNCVKHLRCGICVYVGNLCSLKELASEAAHLGHTEKNNLSHRNEVIMAVETEKSHSTIVKLPNFQEWGVLFEAGQTEALLVRLSQYFEGLEGELNAETVEALTTGVIYLVYNTFAGCGQSVHRVFGEDGLLSPKNLRTKESVQKWMEEVLKRGSETLNATAASDSSVISKIKRYIMEHSGKDISREDISAYVYLNPAYVSRLFKKETGFALSDYIMHVRVENAKRLLLEKSNEKISVVAEKAGYYNPSYFAKLFRKVVGMTPQEYRKRYGR